jgi:uncharacterized protein YqeY
MTDDSILARLTTDIVAAMKAKDAESLSTLRMLKTALMDLKTRKPKDAVLTRDEEIETLQRYAKKRRETIDEMRKLGREDLVAAEEKEIAVTQRYLPKALTEDELAVIVREAVAQTGASGPKDAGKVIGAVMPKVKGMAEGGTVAKLVKQALGG